MTSRERFATIAKGGTADRKPVIWWPGNAHEESDAVIIPADKIGSENTVKDKLCLAEVLNPFGLSKTQGIDLNSVYENDPEAGAEKLNELTNQVKQSIKDALSSGCDGVLYRLHGARGKHCTPMQYGGFYLETDREILSEVPEAYNLVYVVGGEDAYIDFVSDLPAKFFAWDRDATGTSPQEVRELRQGLLATDDEEADILLKSDIKDVASELDLETENSHV